MPAVVRITASTELNSKNGSVIGIGGEQSSQLTLDSIEEPVKAL